LVKVFSQLEAILFHQLDRRRNDFGLDDLRNRASRLLDGLCRASTNPDATWEEDQAENNPGDDRHGPSIL
jgi:hypothetical protein